MRALAIALLVLAASPASAGNARVKACLDLDSNAEQRDCAQALYRDASKELDELVRREPEGLGSLSRCRVLGVVGRPGGSGSFTWGVGCAAEKTLERIEEVKVPFDQR